MQRNTEAFGTGALAIDACRLAVPDRGGYEANYPGDRGHHPRAARGAKELHVSAGRAHDDGRWPPNVLLAHDPDCRATGCAPGCVIAQLDEHAGPRPAGGPLTGHEPSGSVRHVYRRIGRYSWFSYHDTGGPSRFFYTAKTSNAERNAGLHGRLACGDCGELDSRTHPGEDGRPVPCRRNTHATVKPLELVRWLCRLVTPPGGLVLDPFAGSGTTLIAAHLEGLDARGIERDPGHHELAATRLAWWQTQPPGLTVEEILTAHHARRRHHRHGQVSIDDLLGDVA